MEEHKFTNLVQRKLCSEVSADEERELQQLIDSDEQYALRYQLMLEYWSNKDTENANSKRLFQELSSRLAKVEAAGIGETERPKKRSGIRRLYVIRTAAAVAMLALGGAMYHVYIHPYALPEEALQTISTSLSTIKDVTLEDGSTVKLNGSSSLSSMKFLPNSREVTLKGEGFFNIARNPKRPFTIHTSQMDIRVLGTSFNVRAYPDEHTQQAVLIHGSIKVTLHDGLKSVIYLKPKDKLVLDLTEVPGKVNGKDQTFSLSRLDYYKNDSVPAVIETAWTHHHLVFRNEAFESLALKLEIRYGVKIIFQNEAFKRLRFNGTFKKESLQDVLYVLSRTGNPFIYEINGREIIIK